MKIQELLTDKKKWIKGRLAEDRKGNEVSIHEISAECFCLVGSVYRCYKGEFVTGILAKIRDEIAEELRIVNPLERQHISIADYNDSDLTTFEDIKRIITKLDI